MDLLTSCKTMLQVSLKPAIADMRLLLSLILAEFSNAIVDVGLKAHVKTEITLLELHDPELPKSIAHSPNGFGFQGQSGIMIHKIFD